MSYMSHALMLLLLFYVGVLAMENIATVLRMAQHSETRVRAAAAEALTQVACVSDNRVTMLRLGGVCAFCRFALCKLSFTNMLCGVSVCIT